MTVDEYFCFQTGVVFGVSKMKQKTKSPKEVLVPDLQEIDASKEVKKKVIFFSEFCPVGRKDIVTGEKKLGFVNSKK